MKFFRRCWFLLVLICLGCAAQSAPPDVVRRIESKVRNNYSIPPEVKVLVGPLHTGDFPGYDAVTITFDNGKKQEFEFLLAKDGKTLVRMIKMDLTSDPLKDMLKKIDVSNRPTRGNKDAKVVAVNYDDLECPFCSRMHETLFPGILKEYGDKVLFIYKDFPLVDIHPWAIHAAIDSNCLEAQNNDAYWDYVDYLHANQREVGSQKGTDAQFASLDKLALEQGQKHSLDAAKLQACVKAQDDKMVRASMNEGELLGLSATPTMYVNGMKIDGALPPAEVRAVLDRALLDAGVTPPVHKAEAAPSSPPAAPSK